MKASTYRHMTTASCTVLGLMVLPVIVGAWVTHSPSPSIPTNARGDVRALFLIGIGKTSECNAFEIIADTLMIRDPFLAKRIYRKAELVAENQVEIDFTCDSDEMQNLIFQMFEAAPWCDVRIAAIKFKSMDDLDITLLVYIQSEDDVRAYLARIKAGERIDWQEKVAKAKLAQMEAGLHFPTCAE